MSDWQAESIYLGNYNYSVIDRLQLPQHVLTPVPSSSSASDSESFQSKPVESESASEKPNRAMTSFTFGHGMLVNSASNLNRGRKIFQGSERYSRPKEATPQRRLTRW
jgi:hypothetical protein